MSCEEIVVREIQSLMMKVIVFVFFSCLFLQVQTEDIDRYTLCEICLRTAQEIEKVMKEASAESRLKTIENLISGRVCKKLSHNPKHLSREKLVAFCMHLLDTYYDQFHAVLENETPNHLDIVLCYKQSTACVGVKRHSFDSKATFRESDIDALLLDNKDKVRISRPIQSGPSVHSKDEL